MSYREYIRKGDNATARLAPKVVDVRFDLCVATNGRNDWRDLERPSPRLKCGHIYRCSERVGIEHDCDPLETRSDLREQLKPLASQRDFVGGEACDVPIRAIESHNDAAGEGIGRARKHDRDRPRLPLEGDGPGA